MMFEPSWFRILRVALFGAAYALVLGWVGFILVFPFMLMR